MKDDEEMHRLAKSLKDSGIAVSYNDAIQKAKDILHIDRMYSTPKRPDEPLERKRIDEKIPPVSRKEKAIEKEIEVFKEEVDEVEKVTEKEVQDLDESVDRIEEEEREVSVDESDEGSVDILEDIRQKVEQMGGKADIEEKKVDEELHDNLTDVAAGGLNEPTSQNLIDEVSDEDDIPHVEEEEKEDIEVVEAKDPEITLPTADELEVDIHEDIRPLKELLDEPHEKHLEEREEDFLVLPDEDEKMADQLSSEDKEEDPAIDLPEGDQFILDGKDEGTEDASPKAKEHPEDDALTDDDVEDEVEDEFSEEK